MYFTCTNNVFALLCKYMTTLTIRIEDSLKEKAFKEAQKLGIPLTLVVKNALIHFVESPRLVIGNPESIEVSQDLQKKMDVIGTLISKIPA